MNKYLPKNELRLYSLLLFCAINGKISVAETSALLSPAEFQDFMAATIDKDIEVRDGELWMTSAYFDKMTQFIKKSIKLLK